MALNGKGEPQPTLLAAATQAATVELFTQWQTYANGVHMDWDTFRSIDFRAIAVAVVTGAGFAVKALDVALQLPTLRDDDLPIQTPAPRDPLAASDALGRKVEYPQPGSAAFAEHMRQVQG